VVITWEPATGATGYLVHRDGQYQAWVPNGTTWTDPNPTPGQTHTYAIRSQDTDKNNSDPATVDLSLP